MREQPERTVWKEEKRGDTPGSRKERDEPILMHLYTQLTLRRRGLCVCLCGSVCPCVCLCVETCGLICGQMREEGQRIMLEWSLIYMLMYVCVCVCAHTHLCVCVILTQIIIVA